MKIQCRCFLLVLLLSYEVYSQSIYPDDLEYLGAFRLPDGPPEIGWEWCGEALAYWQQGDPTGPDDGFPGSLFGTGHNWNTWVSEINIPEPVVSEIKNVDDLNTAETLQPFADIRSGLFGYLEIPRVGLEVLPAKGEQIDPKIYFCWAPHLAEGDISPTFGWCDLDLANPNTAGKWRIDGLWNYITTDYLFAVPQEWADTCCNGKSLIAGRFRDGGQGSMGPAMIAIAPWQNGNPPAPNASLDYQILLKYCSVYENCPYQLNEYHHSDEWSGGAWIGNKDASAVVFVGTKGKGDCWYGLIDGTVWEEPYPIHLPDSLLQTRGWWSSEFEGQMIFYNPDDLAAVAQGNLYQWEPQPYAVMPLDNVLYHVSGTRQKYHAGAVTADREKGLIYLMEPLADGDKSLIHVWRIQHESRVGRSDSKENFHLSCNYPNPFNPITAIRFSMMKTGYIQMDIFSAIGRLIWSQSRQYPAGKHQIDVDASDWTSGVYVFRMTSGSNRVTLKLVFMK